MKRSFAVGIGVASLLAVAGCSTSGTPSATAGNTIESSFNRSGTPSATSGPSDVPQVANPINTDSFRDNPCDVLTAAQLKELSISTKPEEKDNPLGPGCEWGDLYDDSISIEGTFLIRGQGSSVSGMYKKRDLGQFDYFDPVEILEYPAAIAGVAEDRDHGGCGIGVGVRNDLVYSMSFRLDESHPNYSEPCSVVVEGAEKAVRTMTQGGS